MATYLLLAVPLAILWLGIANRVTVESFIVGYVLGLGLLALRPRRPVKVVWRRLPDQLAASVIYVVVLYRDILLSGIDLARRLLSPDMRLNQGIIAVPTQDRHESQVIAALSAVDVTLTPGELVFEFDGNTIMYVHCLSVEDAAHDADERQARRLSMLQRILGVSS